MTLINEPLVLLPGMMCDARLFLPQISLFSQNRSVVVTPLHGQKTVTGLARQVLDVSPPRFALAGLSMGGIVAMDVVRQAPERVTRLALLDTNPLADLEERAAVRESQVKRVLAGELRSVMRDEMKPNYLAQGPEQKHILNLCMDMADALGPKVFEEQSIALQHRQDQCETLRSLTIPTLVLCGEEDQLCPVAHHELMHELIPDSHLSVIPRAGHLPTLEQPKLTNRILEKWLKF